MASASTEYCCQALNSEFSYAVNLGKMRKIMTESTHPTCVLACPARQTVAPLSMGMWCVALSTVLLLAHLPAIAVAQSSSPRIHVEIPNIKNSTGNIACGIFESAEGFPDKFLSSARAVIIKKIRKTEAQCEFSDIPPGTYAIAVIHDENMNGELDTNWFGVPTEGYGFSNATIDEFGAPAFSAANFSFDGQDIELTSKLNY